MKGAYGSRFKVQGSRFVLRLPPAGEGSVQGFWLGILKSWNLEFGILKSWNLGI
jgi:hypothetical protein